MNKKGEVALLLAGILLISFYAVLPTRAADASITVTDQTNGNDLNNVHVGDMLVLSGTWSTPFTDLYLTIDGEDLATEHFTTTDEDGNWLSDAIPMEERVGGICDLIVTDGIDMVGSPVTVTPSIILDSIEGAPGDTISVEGHGFSTSTRIQHDLRAIFGADPISPFKNFLFENDNGHFWLSFDVPNEAPGIYNLTFYIPDPDDPSIIYSIASVQFATPPGFTLPEYPFGALLALFACFATFALYEKRKNLPNLKLHN